jgi:hypothetical protein
VCREAADTDSAQFRRVGRERTDIPERFAVDHTLLIGGLILIRIQWTIYWV